VTGSDDVAGDRPQFQFRERAGDVQPGMPTEFRVHDRISAFITGQRELTNRPIEPFATGPRAIETSREDYEVRVQERHRDFAVATDCQLHPVARDRVCASDLTAGEGELALLDRIEQFGRDLARDQAPIPSLRDHPAPLAVARPLELLHAQRADPARVGIEHLDSKRVSRDHRDTAGRALSECQSGLYGGDAP
jgi:hypothetical protein